MDKISPNKKRKSQKADFKYHFQKVEAIIKSPVFRFVAILAATILSIIFVQSKFEYSGNLKLDVQFQSAR